MKSNNLGSKLKALRKRKGFSQEELANEAKISLKTIQRIENSQTDPTGDTIKRVALALKITPDELLDWNVIEDNNYLTAINLSALSFLLFPLMSIFIPAIMWLAKKDKVQNLNKTAVDLINFQISWNACLLIGLLVYYILLDLKISSTHEITLDSFTPYFQSIKIYLVAMYSMNLAYIVFNTIRIKRSSSVIYNPKLNLLK